MIMIDVGYILMDYLVVYMEYYDMYIHLNDLTMNGYKNNDICVIFLE